MSSRRLGWVVLAVAGAVLMVVSCSSALRSCSAIHGTLVARGATQADRARLAWEEFHR